MSDLFTILKTRIPVVVLSVIFKLSSVLKAKCFLFTEILLAAGIDRAVWNYELTRPGGKWKFEALL
jgi:hypothetical protein